MTELPVRSLPTLDQIESRPFEISDQLADLARHTAEAAATTDGLPVSIWARAHWGMVHVNVVPACRVENSAFGGIQDCGFGVKDGVIGAMKACGYVKTFSLPW